jgi:hypothetical protein
LFESTDEQRQQGTPAASAHRPSGPDRAARNVERIETARPTTRSTAER